MAEGSPRPLGSVSRLRDFWLGRTDLAPVALFRVLYGLQLFNWIWQLYPSLAPFFTDEGILPRRALLGSYGDRFTLLALVGEWWQVAIFWLLALGVAVALTLGWHSRATSFLAFVVVASFSWRDPLILDGSDFVFRVVPLWLAFTDCGALWSLDARARADRGERSDGSGAALPVRILELQMAWIYLSTGLEKLGGQLWPQGVASYYALQLEHTFARAWARPLATSTLLAPLITWGTLAVELAFLPLAMVPSTLARTAAAVAAAGLHLGILALMNVGNFPVIMLSALVLYLPPSFVRRVVDRAIGVTRARLEPRVAALADGVAAHEHRVIVHPARAKPSSRDVRAILRPVALVVLAALAFSTAMPASLDALRPKGDLSSLLRFLSVDQRWDMFAPEPARADGWMRMPATLADGTRLDLLSGTAPDDRSEGYSDPLYSRWVKVQERIASTAYTDYRLEYARQFCRSRNLHLRPGQSPLETFDIHYVERMIPPPGEGSATFRDVTLWSHHC